MADAHAHDPVKDPYARIRARRAGKPLPPRTPRAGFVAVPTIRMVALMAVGLPITILLGVLVPGLWTLGAAWIAGVIVLAFADLWLAPRPTALTLGLDAPKVLHIGETRTFQLNGAINGERPRLHNAEATLSVGHRLGVHPDRAGFNGGAAAFEVTARRRGEGELLRSWVRWTGPSGLITQQRVIPINQEVGIIPDTRLVRDKAAEIFTRDATHGQKIQRRRGEGTEFDSLVEFTTGMDRRAIDWKHSARHNTLHAKEFRTERNHNIVFAFDTGALMSEPAKDSSGKALTKIDRAINAALLMGFVSLKFGDRVGLYAFDAKPYLFTKPVAGIGAFPHLQAHTSRVDYSENETNFVLGLSSLSQRLSRRSLIVVFTDFVDTVSAELMVENVQRLMRRHLVIFVAFRDDDLERIVTRRPEVSDDIARAVVAETLLRERDLVLARLQRLGVFVLDTSPDELNMDLLNRFMDIKRRELL